MYIFVVIIHLIVCLILMGVVLLQAGKGAEMGAAFGGSSQTIFGSRGAATFLSKLTVGAAVLFMITSLTLSILSRDRSIASSIVDTGKKDELVPKEVPVPGGKDTLPPKGSDDTSKAAPATPPATTAPAPAK
ncbi:MAG: preprotein translocase subunit SecG [Nitrospirae bacterium]|nr:preprotein translocase subunit SecG [Candidatus Manganitrophaceae bacterium]